MNLLLRYIPLGLLALLLWALVRRRAYKVYPWFFTYVAFGVAADVARLLARLSAPNSPVSTPQLIGSRKPATMFSGYS